MDTAQLVFEKMYRKDGFSQWLGIEAILIEDVHCILKMTVRSEMLNGFDVSHGGIVFSFCDSAFAFACNSRNNLSVSIETSINHSKAIKQGDVLTAEAILLTESRKIGTYQVIARNQHNDIVAVFKGICFKKDQTLV